ncbi:hypothetical protein H6P81_005912 [Aristolochia fimbriata]|uniref:Uncharacterized protein n=1 Tax=Aristolochia fimbriata TaxID=158543 RepID=A0AAV7EVZ9_ARIFI|nr:hypothetical protein H6P81_005912 [Aristolochia fimbriata]
MSCNNWYKSGALLTSTQEDLVRGTSGYRGESSVEGVTVCAVDSAGEAWKAACIHTHAEVSGTRHCKLHWWDVTQLQEETGGMSIA